MASTSSAHRTQRVSLLIPSLKYASLQQRGKVLFVPKTSQLRSVSIFSLVSQRHAKSWERSRSKVTAGDVKAAASKIEVASDESIGGFEAWMKNKDFTATKLGHAFFQSEDGTPPLRGCVAKMDITEGELVVRTPRNATLQLKRQEGCPDALREYAAFWNAHPEWFVRLGLKLAWEMKRGPKSLISGYISLLRTDVRQIPGGNQWTEDDLATLAYPPVAQSAQRQKAAWKRLENDLQSMVPNAAITSGELQWACEQCLSRAFGGNFGAGALAWVPVVGLLAELARSGASGQDYVMAPMIDSCNHSSATRTCMDFDPLGGAFELRSASAVPAGTQFLISYGPKSNDELWQRFGFVEEDNPNDCYVIQMEVLERLIGVPGNSFPTLLASAGLDKNLLNDGVTLQRGGQVKNADIVFPGICAVLSHPMPTAGEDANKAITNLLQGAIQQLLDEIVEMDKKVEAHSTSSNLTSMQRLIKDFRAEKARLLQEAL